MRAEKDLRDSSSKFPYQKERGIPGRVRVYLSDENYLSANLCCRNWWRYTLPKVIIGSVGLRDDLKIMFQVRNERITVRIKGKGTINGFLRDKYASFFEKEEGFLKHSLGRAQVHQEKSAIDKIKRVVRQI